MFQNNRPNTSPLTGRLIDTFVPALTVVFVLATVVVDLIDGTAWRVRTDR